jgi:hypothetical protein
MEMIENIVWIIMGFVNTLATMELSWRLAAKSEKMRSIAKPIAYAKNTIVSMK